MAKIPKTQLSVFPPEDSNVLEVLVFLLIIIIFYIDLQSFRQKQFPALSLFKVQGFKMRSQSWFINGPVAASFGFEDENNWVIGIRFENLN